MLLLEAKATEDWTVNFVRAFCFPDLSAPRSLCDHVLAVRP